MISIIDTIKDKINFVLSDRKNYFFVSECTVSKDCVEIFDIITQSKRVFVRDQIDNLDIITWGVNTIPSLPEIEEIKAGNETFFTDNEAEHIENNNKFNEYLDECKEYFNYFDSEYRCNIAQCVVDGLTSSLKRLKILGIKQAFLFTHATFQQQALVRDCYFDLIKKKLTEAIAEIDRNIAEMDDEEFRVEAEEIKRDLENNVDSFKFHMQGVKFDKLFNQWPTLLNPSPFGDDV